MCKEIKEIVTKIVIEHPEIAAIYSDWKPNGFGGIIFVQIPNLTHDECVILGNEYTQYVWDVYEYMTDDMCSAVIFMGTVEEMESLYELVYSREIGDLWMSYNCDITDEDRFIYEHRIYDTIEIFNAIPSIDLLNFIIVEITEYLFAIAHINTKDAVNTKVAFSRLKLSNPSRSLVIVMKQVMDATVHNPEELTLGVMTALRKKSVPAAVKGLLPYFSDTYTIINLFKWISDNYAIYDNIEAYCEKLQISIKDFDSDKLRLMHLLDAYTYADLNEKIVALL